jgi:hypothetical protein
MNTVRIRVIVEAIKDFLARKTMMVVVLTGGGFGWRDVGRRQWRDCQFIFIVLSIAIETAQSTACKLGRDGEREREKKRERERGREREREREKERRLNNMFHLIFFTR